jgi:two-component system sensor kinase FixL
MDRDRSTDEFPGPTTRFVLDNLPQLIAFLDRDLRYLFANRAHFNWFGADPLSLAGRPARDVLGDAVHSVLEHHFNETFSKGSSAFTGHLAFGHGGGRHVHFYTARLQGEAGDADAVLAVMTDLTEFKLIEQALNGSNLRNDSIMNTAVDGIVVIDEKGTIQSFNPGAEHQFGYTAAEVIGRNVSMLMPVPHAAAHDSYLRRYLETGERRIIGIGREVSARRSDGTEFPVDLAVGEFREGGRRYFTGFTRDISARKEAERIARMRLDELAQVNRRSAMNSFASSFAHEISQPLTAIVTMAQAQLRNLRAGRNDPAAIEQILEMIARQGVRTSSIIQQMREFVGKQKTAELSLQRPDAILGDALELLEHDLLGKNVSVRRDFRAGAECILVNRIQIEQVAVNVIQNAVQAMESAGDERVLTVETRVAETTPGMVEIRISDTGIGLPEEGERVFEPFFTTREHGMGQGLSISRSIVEEHGGAIRAERNEGPGATILISLPVARNDAAAKAHEN